ncbi:MAG TPA: YCF48-related protein [Paraburkholderia sp.]
MKTLFLRPVCAVVMAVTLAMVGADAFAAAHALPLKPVPAEKSPIAAQSPLLAAAWAGQRAVSVGANGIVLLSDDRGSSFRQAQQVPVSSMLTGVSFVGPRTGWAVGHWGAILATTNGGETWRIQRLAADEDRPLFAVHFFDAQHGVAVGLWSLVLVTEDGGVTWVEQHVSPRAGTKSDLNLLSLFPDTKGGVFATAEKGQLLHSADSGHTWEYVNTGYKGSLWCGAALNNGELLVGGQRGTLMRSEDGGRNWELVDLSTKSSITSIVANGLDVMVVGLDGFQAQSLDGGRTFRASPRSNGESMTAVLAADNGMWLKFSKQGVVHGTK